MSRKRFDFLSCGTERVMPRKPGPVKGAVITAASGVFCLAALGIPVGSNFIMSFSDSFSIQKFRFTLDNYRGVLELDGALLFLLNNKAASFITGVVIPIDGGFSAYSGV